MERKKPLARTRLATGPRASLRPGDKPLRRTPTRAKATRATGPTAATRAQVLERDHYRCTACGASVLAGKPYNLQHRLRRGAGGRTGPVADYLNSPVNLTVLCGSGTTGCHGDVTGTGHGARTAEQCGWSVPSWADPATVPMFTPYGWVLLDVDGTARATDRPPTGFALDHPGVARLEVAP